MAYTYDAHGVVEVLDIDAYSAPFTAAVRANPDDSTLHRPDIATCGACGRSWDDAVVTACTPAPSAQCPFEYDHESPAVRLEYLRGEIRAERISYGEIFELQELAEHVDPDDYELLAWAGEGGE